MRKFFSKLHLWVSVPFGLVITVTCFTGALLVFENEITEVCSDGAASVEVAGEPLSVDILVERVEAANPDSAKVKSVVISDDAAKAWIVNLSQPKRAAVYVNQYTGEVTGKKERLPFFDTIFRLHRWLMDSNPGNGAVFWGKVVVGTSTLVFVLILVTGLVIWWPRNRKMLKNRLCIVLRKGSNRFWYDLHVAGGFYALLFLLVMALTGLTWSFEWYRNSFYDLFGASDVQVVTTAKATDVSTGATVVSAAPAASTSSTIATTDASSGATAVSASAPATSTSSITATTDASSGATAVSASAPAASTSSTTATIDASSGATTVCDAVEPMFMPWQVAYYTVSSKYAEYSKITVSDGVVTVTLGDCGNVRASDKYTFDSTTGAITSCAPYDETPEKSKLGGWVYSLHVGCWGGALTRVVAFLAALLGATLPLTGYYFWIRRLYRRPSRDNKQ